MKTQTAGQKSRFAITKKGIKRPKRLTKMPQQETVRMRVSTFARESALDAKLASESTRLLNMPRDSKMDGVLRVMLVAQGQLNSSSRSKMGAELIKVLSSAMETRHSPESVLDLLDIFSADIRLLLKFAARAGGVGLEMLSGNGINPCVIMDGKGKLVSLPETFRVAGSDDAEVLANLILPSKRAHQQDAQSVVSLIIPIEIEEAEEAEEEGPSEGGYVFYLTITLGERGKIKYTPTRWDRASAWPQNPKVLEELYFRTLKTMTLLVVVGSVLRAMGWKDHRSRRAKIS